MKYYITTPIYYVNDKPHIGHAYATFIADAFARYHRLKGDDVFFLTGTDENSTKNVEAAREKGFADIQSYLDLQSEAWRATWKELEITNDDFIRTTEERHKKGVEKFFQLVYDKGDIYQGTYQGLYCTGCEAFLRETDLIQGLCPYHKNRPELIEEKNYFFRASKYRDALLAHIEKNPDFVQPLARRNEIVNYIKDHFDDISISREKVKWGIRLPIDEAQVIYVWFDALINYLTGIGYGWDEEKFIRYWPADVHIVGKDIIKFHCALWPAMLLSADLPLPRHIFAHGFFTIEGQKVGKSLGNAIDPVQLCGEYGIDVVRYFLFREIPFGGDGDFSEARLRERYESELAKGLGNFTSRVLTLAQKCPDMHCGTAKLPAEKKAASAAADLRYAWEKGFDHAALHESLTAIFECITWGDRFIDQTKPWILLKEDTASAVQTISILLELLRQLSLYLYPFMPHTAGEIRTQLGLNGDRIPERGNALLAWRAEPIISINKKDNLFPPLIPKA
ncbi:methionine--tRNA ligase [Candidatus Uhrbacteria bacterium]|nr:methionine--tRNA ligase [Candidatus Uhrbacteria bacterium]